MSAWLSLTFLLMKALNISVFLIQLSLFHLLLTPDLVTEWLWLTSLCSSFPSLCSLVHTCLCSPFILLTLLSFHFPILTHIGLRLAFFYSLPLFSKNHELNNFTVIFTWFSYNILFSSIPSFPWILPSHCFQHIQSYHLSVSCWFIFPMTKWVTKIPQADSVFLMGYLHKTSSSC